MTKERASYEKVTQKVSNYFDAKRFSWSFLFISNNFKEVQGKKRSCKHHQQRLLKMLNLPKCLCNSFWHVITKPKMQTFWLGQLFEFSSCQGLDVSVTTFQKKRAFWPEDGMLTFSKCFRYIWPTNGKKLFFSGVLKNLEEICELGPL